MLTNFKVFDLRTSASSTNAILKSRKVLFKSEGCVPKYPGAPTSPKEALLADLRAHSISSIYMHLVPLT